MKNFDLQTDNFRELTSREKHNCSGGGFAYDIGRLIRFIIISGPSGQFTPMAVVDAAAAAHIK